MKQSLLISLAAVLLAGCSPAQQGGRVISAPDGTQWREMGVERLPDMNEPRGNHRTAVLGEEIVVLGGHTDGFKPLETAEYYADGAWHTMPMVYPHATGFAAQLQDGRILLGGGSETFGIGQSWGVEAYDPAAHTFIAVGIMSAKRALPSALPLADGRVLIAGNWYADDSWETWTPEGGFVPGGPIEPGWSDPYILPASADDILVFGTFGNREENPAGLVGHIGGETEQVPLLEQWMPVTRYFNFPEDLQVGEYAYLVVAYDKETYEPAILRVTAGEFSLLEMEEPLPTAGPDGNPIFWGYLQVDRPARLFWLEGFAPHTGNIFFARISYDATFDGGKASMTLFMAETPGGFPSGAVRLLPGGRLVLAGGMGWEKGVFPPANNNFKTYRGTWIFHAEPPQKAGIPLWGLLTLILVMGTGVVLAVLRLRKGPEDDVAPEDEARLSRNLMKQMSELIEEKELYRRKNLRITDLASELATNKTYISVLLNNLSGTNFTDMVNGYRVRHAQQLMETHPDMLLDDVADQSGFSSYTSFFRNFKSVTGLSPQEWKRLESNKAQRGRGEDA